jgi:uncharacterized protein with HEPN domain
MRGRDADATYLRHMLDAADRVLSYIEGRGQADFHATPLLQDGVIRQIQVLGEAAKKLSPELRDAESQVPWKRVTGMREKLVHDYMGVDLHAVWLTATRDVPLLREQINEIVAKSSAG